MRRSITAAWGLTLALAIMFSALTIYSSGLTMGKAPPGHDISVSIDTQIAADAIFTNFNAPISMVGVQDIDRIPAAYNLQTNSVAHATMYREAERSHELFTPLLLTRSETDYRILRVEPTISRLKQIDNPPLAALFRKIPTGYSMAHRWQGLYINI